MVKRLLQRFMKLSRRFVWMTGSFLTMAVLISLFQNFTHLDLAHLKPLYVPPYARAQAAANGTSDIRDLAPARELKPGRNSLAVPQSGSDLGSVGQDWMRRQADLMTGGAEQRLLGTINRKVNRLLKFEEVEGEPWPEPGDDGTGSPLQPSDPTEAEDGNEFFGFKPRSVRMATANRLEVGLHNRSNVSCEVRGSAIQLDVSRPLGRNLDVNLRHDSSGNANTLRLHYNW
jgi:hypothetical protein